MRLIVVILLFVSLSSCEDQEKRTYTKYIPHHKYINAPLHMDDGGRYDAVMILWMDEDSTMFEMDYYLIQDRPTDIAFMKVRLEGKVSQAYKELWYFDTKTSEATYKSSLLPQESEVSKDEFASVELKFDPTRGVIQINGSTYRYKSSMGADRYDHYHTKYERWQGSYVGFD